jgi:hypothetical protein
MLLALFSFFAINLSAQKEKVEVEKESGKITVDGELYAIVLKENAPGQIGLNKNYTITNLDGDELIYMVFSQENVYNKYGQKTDEVKSFYKINFLGSGESSRKKSTMTAKSAAKLLVKNKLILDGKIDPEAEKKFHLKY